MGTINIQKRATRYSQVLKESCENLRLALSPLAQYINDFKEEQLESWFDVTAELHKAPCAEELDLIGDLIKFSNVLNNCTKSIVDHVEAIITEAKKRGTDNLDSLVISLITRANNIALKFFELSKAFDHESCAGMLKVLESVANKLLGKSTEFDVGLGRSLDDDEVEVEPIVNFKADIDSDLEELLRPYTTKLEDDESPSKLFEKMIHCFLDFGDLGGRRFKLKQSFLDEHSGFFQAADLMIKKITQMWCDINLKFIDLFECSAEIHEPTLQLIAKLVDYEWLGFKEPVDNIRGIRDSALSQTKRISTADLDESGWDLNPQTVTYLLHNGVSE